jgi:hypothetical protein
MKPVSTRVGGYLTTQVVKATTDRAREKRQRMKAAARRRVKVIYADDDPGEDAASRERNRNYQAAMALQPKCACGQSIWAPQSVARGFCEACRIAKPLSSSNCRPSDTLTGYPLTLPLEDNVPVDSGSK